MEARHADNIISKARLAVEILETILDTAWPGQTRHDQLKEAHRALFDCTGPDVDKLWAKLGEAYADHRGASTPATFDTSRLAISSEILARIGETENPTVDPFDVFASNDSAKN